jgi:hypothetical protein
MKYFSLSPWTAALAMICPLAAGAQTAPIPPNPQIEISYVKPEKNPALTPIYQQMQSHKVLETLQVFLAPLKLPPGAKLAIKFDECAGAPTVPYVHGGPVTVCYDYVARIEQMVPKATVTLAQGAITPDAAVIGPVAQAALHETALAVFDLFKLPVWGRTEDAADRLAAFIMVQFGPTVAWNTIVGTAWFLSGNASAAPADFSDIGGVVAQRYYTTVCIAYGAEVRGVTLVSTASSAPGGAEGAGFGNFVGTGAAGNLPSSRAKSCPYEYDTIQQAFDRLFVQQKRVDQALLQQVRLSFVCPPAGGQTGPFSLLACARRQ